MQCLEWAPTLSHCPVLLQRPLCLLQWSWIRSALPSLTSVLLNIFFFNNIGGTFSFVGTNLRLAVHGQHLVFRNVLFCYYCVLKWNWLPTLKIRSYHVKSRFFIFLKKKNLKKWQYEEDRDSLMHVRGWACHHGLGRLSLAPPSASGAGFSGCSLPGGVCNSFIMVY